MEQNPSSGRYRGLLSKYLFSSRNKVIHNIAVNEVFSPLRNIDIDGQIAELKKSIEKDHEFSEKYIASIEQLFEEDEAVSNFFNLLGGS